MKKQPAKEALAVESGVNAFLIVIFLLTFFVPVLVVPEILDNAFNAPKNLLIIAGSTILLCLYLAGASLATLVCYQASAQAAILAGYFALVGLGGVWAIVTTWTAELFPTEMRATASGFGNNLVGRLGLVLGPIVAGILGEAFDSTAAAVSLLAIVPLVGVPIAWMLPETRAIALAPGTGPSP